MILLPFIYFLLFAFIIYKSKFFDDTYLSKKQYLFFYSLKVLAGLVLYLIYTRHYTYRNTSDALRFFDDANVVYKDIGKNPILYFKMMLGVDCDGPQYQHYYELMNNWTKEFDYSLYNDNRTIIRANMFMLLFSFGNYHVHTLILNFISFIGLIMLLKFLYNRSMINPLYLAFILFLTPSLLFWGSGVLKEGVLLFALGGLCFSYNKALAKNFTAVLYFVLFAALLLLSKFYVFVAIIPSLLAMYLVQHFKKLSPFFIYLSLHILGFLFIIYGGKYLLNYDFLATISAKQEDFIDVAKLWNATSTVEIPLINNSVQNLIISLPQALTNSLFRPLFFDAKNAMMLISSVENAFFIVLIALSIVYCNRKKVNEVIYLSIFFTLTLGALIGWVTPVLGAIVRYKIPLLPFFALIPVYFINFDRLPEFVKQIINTFLNTFIKWTR